MKEKNELRNKIKKIRKTLDNNLVSKIITQKILQMEIFKNSENIMLYYPLRYEINILGLMKKDKNFYFPKVSGENLLVCPYCGDFEKSCMNIYEPCSNPVSPEILDLIIVPALAIDKNNYRLGYGGGFYDRFLKQNSKVKTITPIFKELIFTRLPHEEFDIQIDYTVSDE